VKLVAALSALMVLLAGSAWAVSLSDGIEAALQPLMIEMEEQLSQLRENLPANYKLTKDTKQTEYLTQQELPNGESPIVSGMQTSPIDGTWKMASGNFEAILLGSKVGAAHVNLATVRPSEFPIRMTADSGGTHTIRLNTSTAPVYIDWIITEGTTNPGMEYLAHQSGLEKVSETVYRVTEVSDTGNILSMSIVLSNNSTLSVKMEGTDPDDILKMEYAFVFTRVGGGNGGGGGGCNAAPGLLGVLSLIPLLIIKRKR